MERHGDARGRLVELRQYTQGTLAGDYQATTYAYDHAGNLAQVTDPVGNEWLYEHDLRGRQVGSSDPDRGTTTTVFDDAGQVVSTTDARGLALVYLRDGLGRVTELRQGSQIGTLRASWVYDTLAKGQVTSSTRYDGGEYTVAVTGYDEGYRPLGQSVTLPAVEGELAGMWTTSYAYAANGQLESTTLPAAGGLAQETVTTYYDELSVPEWTGGGDGFGAYVAGSSYSVFGQPLVYDLGTSAASLLSYSYEAGTRRLDRTWLVREGAAGYDLDLAYTYDDAGNPTSVVDTPTVAGGQGDAQCFAYDGLRRLTSAWTPGDADCAAAPAVQDLGGAAPYWMDYTFDAVGNRTGTVSHASEGNTTSSYSYPAPAAAGAHQLSQVVTTGPGGATTDTYAYDPAGNTITRALDGEPAQTLTWDAEGELTAVTEDSELVGEYLYSADGDRLVRRQDDVTTVYLPGGQELALDPVGEVTATRYYTFNGQTIATRSDDGTVTSLVSDPHGTASLAIDNTTGAITHRYTDPYGLPRGTTPAWPGDHGYLDRPTDATGLVQLGARYYDPALGRFASVDPVMDLTDPQQWNGYSYAGNNPNTYTDPTGLKPKDSKDKVVANTNKGASKVQPRAAAVLGPSTVHPPVRSGCQGYDCYLEWQRSSDFGQVVDHVYEQMSDWRQGDWRRVVELFNDHKDFVNEQARRGADYARGNTSFWEVTRHAISYHPIDRTGVIITGMLKEIGSNFDSGGPWDAKVSLREEFGAGPGGSREYVDMRNGREMYFDVFGNVVYGYMMAEAGITQETALYVSRAAGNPERGDDPAIGLGFDLFELYGDDLTSDEFYDFLHSGRTSQELVGVGRVRQRGVG